MKTTKTASLLASAALTAALGLLPSALAAPADFLGTWVNSNVTTSGITRVNVTQNADKTLSVQVFGRCSPNDCDWGKANVITYGKTVSDTNAMIGTAVFNKGFSTTMLILTMNGGSMTVQAMTQFTDGSGRQNYAMGDSFARYR